MTAFYSSPALKPGPLIFAVLQDVGWKHVTGTLPANPLRVINTNDSGPGSLRYAVDYANAHLGDDTITSQIPGAGPHVITLTTGRINIHSNITIQGPGASVVSVDGNNGKRVFYIRGSGVTVNISGLTIQNGRAADTGDSTGGGIFAQFATLSVSNCVITNNYAGTAGGGIYALASGNLTVNSCTFSNNQAEFTTNSAGGGISYQGTSLDPTGRVVLVTLKKPA